MHLWTFTCACKVWPPLPSSFEFCVMWGMMRLFQFFLFLHFCCIIFSCLVLFSPKLYSIKKQTKYKKRKKCFFSCFVGFKFLLIKGDGQLDRHTDKQISWLINTNYRCEKNKWRIFLLHCTHGQKVTTAVFFSIFFNT